MTRPLELVIVTGGLRSPSSTRLLADRLGEAAERELTSLAVPIDVQVYELRELAVDIANNLITGFPPPALRAVVDAVTRAAGLIAVTPTFGGSYSGLFKSFIDVLDRDTLAGKPVLIASTGGTARHSLALEYAMRPLFAHLRAHVVPTAVFAAPEDWGSAGDDRTSALIGRVQRAAAELSALIAQRTPQAAPDADDVLPFEQQLTALRGTQD